MGQRQVFWLLNSETSRYFSATAVLRKVTDHGLFYLQEGVEATEEAIDRSATEFEERIYPAITRYFGPPRSPGVDNDSRVAIIGANTPGVLGYFSELDFYPKMVHPYSNERNAIYINASLARIGARLFNATVAHELQHLIHFGADPAQQAWISEGLSEVAIDLAGYEAGSPRNFLSSPDIQLNHLGERLDYGATYLFMKYIVEHFGGPDAIRDLVSGSGRGIKRIEDFLVKRGSGKEFMGLFKDWIVANFVNTGDGGLYSYSSARIKITGAEPVADFSPKQSQVHQFAAKYFDLRPAATDFSINFTGAAKVKVIPNEPRSGVRQWWSNRGDSIDTTLTREFDLSGLSKATLNFWLWYDMEKGYDYAYVEASTDNGLTWDVLAGRHTSEENPVGNSYGPAYTGNSGGGKEPIWVYETMDLTPYVGKRVLVRFEYVTDGEITHEGLAIDDLSVLEVGFSDSAESDAGWVARGFVRTDNELDQRYIVRLIEMGPPDAGGITVRDMALDQRQSGSLEVKGLGTTVSRAVLVVAGATDGSLQSAPFGISLQRAP